MQLSRLFRRKQNFTLEVEGLGTLTRQGRDKQPRYIWRGICNFLWWENIAVDLNYEEGEDLEPMAESLSQCLSADQQRLREEIQQAMDAKFKGEDLWTTDGEPATLYLGAYSEINVTYFTPTHSVTILLQGDHLSNFICERMPA